MNTEMKYFAAFVLNIMFLLLRLRIVECSVKTMKVIPTWTNGSDILTCGFEGRQYYKPFQCKTTSCNSTCDYKCPTDQRNKTVLYSYIDLLENVNLTVSAYIKISS